MGRNLVLERSLKKPSGGGGRSPGELLGEKGIPASGQSRFPSVRAFAFDMSSHPTSRRLLTASSQTVSRALKEECNIHHRAFAMVYLDHQGRTRFEASSTVQPFLSDIFSPDVCQTFLQAVEGRGRGRRSAQSGQQSLV